jgi:hypothetical protein
MEDSGSWFFLMDLPEREKPDHLEIVALLAQRPDEQHDFMAQFRVGNLVIGANKFQRFPPVERIGIGGPGGLGLTG